MRRFASRPTALLSKSTAWKRDARRAGVALWGAVALLTIAPASHAFVAFSDGFNRANSASLGADWVEAEAGLSKFLIETNTARLDMVFNDPNLAVDVAHAVTTQTFFPAGLGVTASVKETPLFGGATVLHGVGFASPADDDVDIISFAVEGESDGFFDAVLIRPDPTGPGSVTVVAFDIALSDGLDFNLLSLQISQDKTSLTASFDGTTIFNSTLDPADLTGAVTVKIGSPGLDGISGAGSARVGDLFYDDVTVTTGDVVIDFNAGIGIPVTYSERSVTVRSINADPSHHLHLGDNVGSGSPNLRNHSSCCSTPYEITSIGNFCLLSLEVVGGSSPGTFTSDTATAVVVPNTLGTFNFPAGFCGAKFTWEQAVGDLVIDDLNLADLAPGPIADAGGPYLISATDPLLLDASGSAHEDALGVLVSFEWDIDGDGAFDDASGATVLLGPCEAADLTGGTGVHQISVRVTDDGGLSDVAAVDVEITAAISRPIRVIIDSTGDGTTGLFLPKGIAIGPSGNAYIAAWASIFSNAFEVTPLGQITEIIDGSGDGAGEPLTLPFGIDVDAGENVLIAGRFSHNLFEITPSGGITAILSSTTPVPYVDPHDVIVASDGTLYTTARSSDRVYEITTAGVVTEIIDATGDGAGNILDGPRGVTVDASNNVYMAADQSHNVFEVTPAGVVTEILDATGDGAGNSFTAGFGIDVSDSGTVYVVGEVSDNVFEITPAGVITELIDASGDGMGNPLDQPKSVVVAPSGNVYVTGAASNNVFRIDPAGVVSEIIDATGDGLGAALSGPHGIAIDRCENVYVTGETSNNAFVIPVPEPGKKLQLAAGIVALGLLHALRWRKRLTGRQPGRGAKEGRPS